MKRKNYLLEGLSKEEKGYLVRIVMTARNKYIEKNNDYINNTNELWDESIIREYSLLETVLKRCQDDVNSAVEFEKALSNPELYKIVKALSLKEKEVLFYLYKRQKSINEVAAIMNLDRKTIRRIRDKAQAQIAQKLLEGEW